jgi:four helix bundle protein
MRGGMRESGMTTDEGKAGFSDPLERVTAYQLALVVADMVRRDVEEMRKDVVMREVAGQLLRAAGSVAANTAEGYARGTAADRKKFYEYALGSERETEAWYHTAGKEPSADLRARLLSIRRLLLTMIRHARENTSRITFQK